MKQLDLEQFSSQCALFPPIIIDYGLGSSIVIYLLIEIQSFSCKRRLKLPVYQQQLYLSLTVLTLEKNLGALFSKPLNRETN